MSFTARLKCFLFDHLWGLFIDENDRLYTKCIKCGVRFPFRNRSAS